MPLFHWLSVSAKSLFTKTRGCRRRLAARQAVTSLDSLEPRLLLTATALGDIPDVRFAQAGDSTEFELDQFFDDPDISGSVVKVAFTPEIVPRVDPLVEPDPDDRAFYIETYDTITPITATNFLNLVANGNYDDMFFHRLNPDFVLQGGGFTFPETSTTTRSVANNGTIVNEFDNWFDPDLGGLNAGDPVNVRGTLAMAKQSGDPDSATSQWFVSLEDNQALLDPQNGGFTVFAHVLFDGMDVIDQIRTLEIVNVNSPFNELPVVDLAADATAITRENLLLTTSSIVEELSYTTTTSDLVTTELVDGKLTLTATAAGISQGGSTQISVTATDLQGNAVTTVVNVDLAQPTVTGPTGVATSLPTISWSAAAGADSYDLRIDRLDDRFATVIQTDDVVSVDGIVGTSFTVTEDLPDGQYSASVRKRTASGTESFSPDFVFYVGLDTPAAVNTPAVTLSGENGSDVTIGWDEANDSTHYDIWISEVGGGVIHRENWISGTSYDASDLLQPGSSYRVWVRGQNVLGTGAWSPGVQFVAGTTVPERVVIISPEAGVIATTSPTFTWDADALATEYEIYIAAEGSNAAVVRTTVSETSYTEPGTLADGFYRVWVRAKNGNGSGAWSSALTFGISSSGAASVITGPTGDAISTQPQITWTAGVPGGTYELWVNQVGGQSRVIHETGITTTTFTPSTELANGAFTAWIRQVTADGGRIPWSSAFRFEVGASTAPARPNLAIDQSGDTPTFSWEADAAAERYELWVNLGSTRVLHITSLTSLQHIATELQATGDHRAWLRGIGSNNVAGEWSSVLSFTI